MIKTPLSTVLGGAFWTPGCTVVGSTPNLDRQIAKLFSNGEQGFYYDPNDLNTMIQDAAGTVPVTDVGKPVGLLLDKSKGLVLGVEKKGTATTQLVGSATAATYNSSTGEATCARAGVSNQSFIRISGLTGTYYKLAITNTGTTPVSVRAGLNSNDQLILSVANGRSATFFIAPRNGAVTLTSGGGTASFTINYIKELTGNHAYQTTSASRPILQDAPRRIDFDAVDDKLITNLPAQLTGCTVIRSVPNVGTQILIGQTIPATYEDNKDHCGLIVINRVLTPSETSAITDEFNKRAGV